MAPRFDSPGSLRDVPVGSPFYDAWHRTVAQLIRDRVRLSGTGWSVDPSRRPFEPAEHRVQTWTGFSRPLLTEHRDDRMAAFLAGEDRATQIEYLEWHVTRVGGVITRVVFVTETPEYWTTLAAAAPDVVVARYRELVDPSVTKADLFPDGRRYDQDNRWNTTDGIVHYVMPINSMRDLLGVSQEPEERAGSRDGYDPLPYSRDTAADARIGYENWALTRTGRTIGSALAPGLYIAGWDDSGWERPDGRPVGDHWTIERGRPGAALRVAYEVPDGEGFRVGDIRIGGRPVVTGGQLAEHVVVSAHVAVGAVP